MKNFRLSVISLILSIAILFSSVIIPSYAVNDEGISQNANTDQIIDYTQNTYQGLDADELVPIYENDIVITEPGSAGEGVYEILSMRDENTKYISLGGGRYQAVSYMEAVHRKASDGSFVDIDNRISLVGDKYITPDSRVSFDKNNAGFTIDEEGYKISLELSVSDIDNKIDANENASLVEITNHEERTEDLSSLTALEKLERIRNVDNKSTLKYVSVNANTDVEYILASNDVKENIIVKNRADSYEYSFLLTLDGLYAEENEDGSISLCDSESDENKYVIPAPYMYDANDVYSYDVDYELIPVPDKDGIYILLVTADEEFINSDEREFPVVIDPTVTTPKIDVQDTYIDSNNPGYPHGYGSRLYVGSKITYIKTDLPNLPEGATLASAKLYVPYYFDSAYKYGRADICANQMMNDWDEYTLTWNAASAMTNSPNSIYMGYKQSYSCLVSFSYSSIYPVYATFNITSFANMWYSGEAQNYGIALTRVSGDIDEAIIYSRESSGSHRSYMIYEYVSEYIPNGVYAIKNVGDPTCYAMADAATPVNAAVLKKGTYTTSPAIEFARSALFKIIRVEGTNRYVIRSMLNNEYILAFSESGVVTKKANPNDMQVSEYDTFYIEPSNDGSGFYIKQYDSDSSYVMAISSTSDNLEKTPGNPTSTQMIWDFEIYPGEHQKGGNIYASHIYAGESGTLYPYVWSTVIGRNEVAVDVGYTDIVSPYWNQTDKILYLSGHDEGSVPISVNIKGYTTNEYEPILEVDYHVYLPFEEGTYFFRNRQLQNYMQIDNDDATNYSTSKPSLELFSFDSGDYQKWNVEHVYDGYYKIVSAKNGLVVSVQENYLNTAEKEVVQETYTGADRQQWNFEVTGRGTYIVRAKSNVGNTTDLSLCSKVSGSTNGRKVVQGTYIENSTYYDEWWLYEIGSIIDLELEGQQKSQWCWAASARMFAGNYASPITATQDKMVEDVTGSDANEPRNLDYSAQAVRYYISSAGSNAQQIQLYRDYGRYAEDKVKQFIEDGHVLFIAIGAYLNPTSSNPQFERESGHAVIIAGYVYLNDDIRFIIYDPWPVNSGKIYLTSYQNLICDNRPDSIAEDDIIDGDNYYDKWDSVLVYHTYYASDLLPMYSSN